MTAFDHIHRIGTLDGLAAYSGAVGPTTPGTRRVVFTVQVLADVPEHQDTDDLCSVLEDAILTTDGGRLLGVLEALAYRVEEVQA